MIALGKLFVTPEAMNGGMTKSTYRDCVIQIGSVITLLYQTAVDFARIQMVTC